MHLWPLRSRVLAQDDESPPAEEDLLQEVGRLLEGAGRLGPGKGFPEIRGGLHVPLEGKRGENMKNVRNH